MLDVSSDDMWQEVKERVCAIRLSDGTVVGGVVNIGGHDRLSDFLLDQSTDFVVLFKVNANIGSKVMMINKKHIVYIEPMEPAHPQRGKQNNRKKEKKQKKQPTLEEQGYSILDEQPVQKIVNMSARTRARMR